MKKRTEKPKSYAQCVTGHYLSLDGGNRAYDIELRNARVTYRDRSQYGQVVDIKVEETTDHIQMFNPEVRMWGGLVNMQGFLLVVRANGKLLDPEHGNPELPMRLVNLYIRPECGLDDDGVWLD